MILNEILGLVGIISGVVIFVSTIGFIYFIITAYKYGSKTEANKFFGSYMLNNPIRYVFAFIFIVISAVSLSIGFIASFIAVFFFNPLIIWEVSGTVAIISLACFFVAFTSIDHPSRFLSYIRFLKNKR
ncbi:MAG: hypothetical protein BJBARM5_1797 [Candidatus Parvarchaeum acidophilus ARMAN-5]|jgi:magnesium-transporting ATPase (P-type)|uniref:Uncharacterized protein n=1 Tax=Candidatus Parvarchaeum acidophilus ARMAN-5 TaxID=662762 RepID=D6GWL1_PARA5|nr:MAG: hypothetical protein BJBARM5_1797 [Candidatus Parvarchaeum acidophilus ARMAN-5]